MDKMRQRLSIVILVTIFVFLLPALTVILGVGAQTNNIISIELPHYLLTVVVYPGSPAFDQRPLVKIGIVTPNYPNEFGKPVGDECIWYGFTTPVSTTGIYRHSVSVVLPQGEYIVWVAYEAQLVNMNQTRTITFS